MNVNATVTQGLMPDITVPTYPAGVPQLAGCKFNLESLLPLSLIRTHTKTDDVPSVTDEQLTLYRQAAFETCEKYTGRLFTEIRVITETVGAPRPRNGRLWRRDYRHRLSYRSTDGAVYLYGARGVPPQLIHVAPGSNEIRIPVVHNVLDGNCCLPCGAGQDLNHGMRVMYRAGYDCGKDAVPAGILVGCLKFIAWLIQNPGDEIMTVRNRQSSESTGIIGTNNGAWASGAIEQWRIFVDEAI